MAALNGTRREPWPHVNGAACAADPPSSSILASHVASANGNQLPHFDRESFAQLLDESLGQDEDGQPNLGTDISINHRLICIIVKAGIDTANTNNLDDPFVRGRDKLDHILRCLEVIDLALQRSPDVLHRISGPEDHGAGDESVPLFMWLIPKLLSLIGIADGETHTVSDKCRMILNGAASMQSRSAQCTRNALAISSFTAVCANGKPKLCRKDNPY